MKDITRNRPLKSGTNSKLIWENNVFLHVLSKINMIENTPYDVRT